MQARIDDRPCHPILRAERHIADRRCTAMAAQHAFAIQKIMDAASAFDHIPGIDRYAEKAFLAIVEHGGVLAQRVERSAARSDALRAKAANDEIASCKSVEGEIFSVLTFDEIDESLPDNGLSIAVWAHCVRVLQSSSNLGGGQR